MNQLEPYSFSVYWKDNLTASVTISADRKSVDYQRYSNNMAEAPFMFSNPTAEQMFDFLESRCMDKHRTQINEYLNDLGLTEYNPYEIVKKTHGVMWEDFMWLKFPNEDISWEDVKVRGKL